MVLEAGYVVPAQQATLAETRRLKDELEWAREREYTNESVLQSARKETIRQQADTVTLAAENLRLMQELNRELAKRKAEQP